jgi:hypothetical protein
VPFAKHAGCFFLALALGESRLEVASQKLCRAPCRPIKASGLTWAKRAGGAVTPTTRVVRVRSQLGRRAAIARSLRAALGRGHTTCAAYFALPCQLVVVRPAGVRPANQTERGRELGRMEASRDPSGKVPKIALVRGFLGGVRPWRASVRPCSSTTRCGVGPLAQGGRRGTAQRDACLARRGTGMRSRAHSSSAPS